MSYICVEHMYSFKRQKYQSRSVGLWLVNIGITLFFFLKPVVNALTILKLKLYSRVWRKAEVKQTALRCSLLLHG